MAQKKNSDDNLSAKQRIYRITKDSDHTSKLISNGYESAHEIISDPFNEFVEKTELNKKKAEKYYLKALYVESEVYEN